MGGIDPGTGAGLARDLLTANALGARATVIGTAWTEQQAAFAVEPRDPERVRAALSNALAGERSAAVKIGMVATADIARAVGGGAGRVRGPRRLRSRAARVERRHRSTTAIARAFSRLARRATLLTPNLAEAAWLLERPVHHAGRGARRRARSSRSGHRRGAGQGRPPRGRRHRRAALDGGETRARGPAHRRAEPARHRLRAGHRHRRASWPAGTPSSARSPPPRPGSASASPAPSSSTANATCKARRRRSAGTIQRGRGASRIPLRRRRRPGAQLLDHGTQAGEARTAAASGPR